MRYFHLYIFVAKITQSDRFCWIHEGKLKNFSYALTRRYAALKIYIWPLLDVFDGLLFGRPGVFIQKLRKKKSTVAVTVWCTSVDFVLLLLIRQGHAGVSLQRKCI